MNSSPPLTISCMQQRWKSIISSLEPLEIETASTGLGLQSSRARASATVFSSAFPNRSQTTRNTNSPKFFFGSFLPPSEPPKTSVKGNGCVKAYAAATNQGLVRSYNEDRVSIVLNIVKPPNREGETWPACSFFGVYDGHGGSSCADFLRDHLHQFVTRNHFFPFKPKEALKHGFETAERIFLERASRCQPIERSGSCAIVALVVGDICYVANVGDSRAVLASHSKVYALSKDHKPSDEKEQARIIQNGGKVYQTVSNPSQSLMGPHRVLPGRLSVSRTFGDVEGKLPALGGNPQVLIATPEIKSFRISPDHDFLILGSDGVFDKLRNREVISCAWEALKTPKDTIHQQSGEIVEEILRTAMSRKSLDNVTCVFVCFNERVGKIN